MSTVIHSVTLEDVPLVLVPREPVDGTRFGVWCERSIVLKFRSTVDGRTLADAILQGCDAADAADAIRAWGLDEPETGVPA